MRVAFVIAGAGAGGMETHVRTVIRTLAQHCSVALVAHPSLLHDLEGVTTFPLESLAHASRHNPLLLAKLRRIIREFNPEILHAHGSKAAQLLARRCFQRYVRVATIHGIKKHLEFTRHYDRLIAVSPSAARQLPPEKTSIIFNGVESPFIDKIPQRPQHAVPQLLAIGRLAPVKGFDRLIDAIATIPDVELNLAGDGPERSRLQEKIETLGLEKRVHLLGHRTDAHELLAQSDLLLISSHREGLPLVLAEAIHANCPVFSTPAGGVTDLLPLEFIAPAESYAERLRDLLKSLPSYTESFIQFADQVREQLTVEAMVEQTLKAYNLALEVERPQGCALHLCKHPSLPLFLASIPLIALSLWFLPLVIGLLLWTLCDYTIWRLPASVHYPRVLMYHAIGELVPHAMPPELCVRPSDFRRQLQLLKRKGYEFLFASELVERKDLTRCVAITFDDGFESVYREALPILHELGVKATIFLSAHSDIAHSQLLSAEQITSLAQDNLLQLGGHTYHHINLATTSPEEGQRDIAEGVAWHTLLTGQPPRVFAYPYGRLREETPAALFGQGFICALTVKKGLAPITDRYRIRRTNVLRSCDLLQFRLLLRSGRYRV